MAESHGRELPEYLSEADQKRFIEDADFREERRERKRGDIPNPKLDSILRGYKRTWLYDGSTPVPPIEALPDELAHRLEVKMRRMRPVVDEITRHYNLGIANKVALRPYIEVPAERFKSKVSEEGHDETALEILEQATIRIPIHVGDNLQRNLWLKTRISQLRLANLERFAAHSDADWSEEGNVLAVVSDAIADFGYCLRNDDGIGRKLQGDENDIQRKIQTGNRKASDKLLVDGLLRNVGVDRTMGNTIEHIGLYISDGHSDFLSENLGLVALVRSQQQVRSDYWGSRLATTMEELGEVLPETERETDRILVGWLEELYGSPEPRPELSQ
ncbi:MAG TPA: hypothetical protein VLF90_02155 [Patescibacteria group bacterium]|nr:hypothetical protein [Patescibacteria group bacterium]